MEFFVYIYLDPRSKGDYSFRDVNFGYKPFYVGIGKGNRHLSHLKETLENTTNKAKFYKIRKIRQEGFEPIVFKIFEEIDRNTACDIEREFISYFGKLNNKGVLTNITDGGDGGITWVGEHHNKGKKLEEIVGEKRSSELKSELSERAKKRVGDKNPNYGNGEKISGKKHSNFGGKFMKNEVKKKISCSLKEYFKELSKEDRVELTKKQRKWFKELSDDEKLKYGEKISNSLKGRVFSEKHREKISKNNYKSKNKGSSVLKLSKETKDKISLAQKGKSLSKEHIDKLRKGYTYEEWKDEISNFIIENKIQSITDYRNRCRELDCKMPKSPEGAFKRHNWEGWDKYRDLFKS